MSAATVLAHAVAASGSDQGLCEAAITLPARSARLLTPAEVLTERFRDDVWWLIRDADEVALANAAEYIRSTRPADRWRSVVVTQLPLGIVSRTIASAGVSDFALVDAT
jgi:hypothetical protein